MALSLARVDHVRTGVGGMGIFSRGYVRRQRLCVEPACSFPGSEADAGLVAAMAGLYDLSVASDRGDRREICMDRTVVARTGLGVRGVHDSAAADDRID